MTETWVPGATGSGHDVDHLPYGVFSAADDDPRVGARIGDFVLDLAPIATLEMHPAASAVAAGTLDALLALGPRTREHLRAWMVELLTTDADQDAVEPYLVPIEEVTMHHPFTVADYVDFYASEHHASNVGRILRPDDADPLVPAWRHLPIGYHGRAGTVVVSGTPVVRPVGQRPSYGPSERLDLEAELGFVVGTGSAPGRPVPTSAFADHVAGVVLVNDWSARDLQAFEYRPLGPFLGKSFATSIGAWLTPLDALEAARVELPGQDPPPAEHLGVEGPAGYDIDLEVRLNDALIATCPYASTYWSPAQMLAHLTSNGARLRAGDLFASGTVSGPGTDQRGSLMELSWGGRDALQLPDGSTRTFLEDGDTVEITATAPGRLGGRIRLGDVSGTVVPARHA